MRVRGLTTVLVALLALGALLIPAAASAAPPAPAWTAQTMAGPTNFKPGDETALNIYEAFVSNSGAKATDQSSITITDTLPAGLDIKDVEVFVTRRQFIDLNKSGEACETNTVAEVATVSCEIDEGLSVPGISEPARIEPDEQILVRIKVTAPTAGGPLTNQVEVDGGGAEAAAATVSNQAIDAAAKAGFQDFQDALTGPDGKPTTTAASHPHEYTNSFTVNLNPAPPGSSLPFVPAGGDLAHVVGELPPGLVGNPTATVRCSAQQFNTVSLVPSKEGGNVSVNECPDASAVGLIAIQQLEGEGSVGVLPLYNLVPPPGMPAQLGFEYPPVGVPIYINTQLRSDGDYGITASVDSITEAKRLSSSRVMVWGTPADPGHDGQRGRCANLGGSCPVPGTPRPFLRLPTSCEKPLQHLLRFDTWSDPGTFVGSTVTEPPPTACDAPDFSPSIESRPTTNVADAPSGLHFSLHLPQEANEDPEGVGEADLRDATVTLPEGLVVNPSSANGLGACSLEQIGYQGQVEGKPSFTAEPASCPDAAKIGTVEVESPLVDHPLPGAVYLAQQSENPFNSLIAIYIAIEDPQTGVVVKLAGKVSPDPLTGRLTTTVAQSPQVPFEDFSFEFFEGARAPLRTPQTCGPHTTNTSLVPWSAPAGATAFPSDSFALAQSPSGACAASKAALPNSPTFEAGTADPLAAAYSPFLLRLKREDGSQELAGLNVSLPQGLTAKLAGTAECSEAQIAQAKAREAPGQGAIEKASPSCPASSQLGTVTVGAGAGPSPFYTEGNAYLAGPYKGAPLSMAIITPAVAGPFDLGTVVVRAALHVDPESARVSVKSDPIPTILQGIPLDVRSIAVQIDRPGFTLNPTSCDAMALTAEAISTENQVANLQNRFQVGGCSSLGFKPKLAFKLKGDTKRGGFPALTATLTYPKAGAYSNIARAQVALPHSEFLAQAHIRTICTRVQFAADTCPKGSIYGKAKAITPLLDKPLEGPVYLRSSSNLLPDLVADLNGRIHVALVGRIDSVNGSIRNSFEAVPDAPVSRFTLSLPAGKKGLLENSTDICRGKHRANATFTAHNGKVLVLRPELKARCKAKGRKGSKGRKG